MAKSTTIYGLHAVTTAVTRHPERVLSLLVDQKRADKRMETVLNEAYQHGISVEQANKQQLDKLADGAHQGVVARVKPVEVFNEQFLEKLLEDLDEPAFLLVLDGVTDPHNLGACLRTADAVGVHAVIAPRDNSAPLNATACKVACGAAESVPYVTVTNLSRMLKQLQQYGVWITGTAGEAEQDIYQADLKGSMALVMGAEGKGMRRLTRDHCDQLVKIPMAGEVSSLNVSVATGVCLYEVVRQRLGS